MSDAEITDPRIERIASLLEQRIRERVGDRLITASELREIVVAVVDELMAEAGYPAIRVSRDPSDPLHLVVEVPIEEPRVDPDPVAGELNVEGSGREEREV